MARRRREEPEENSHERWLVSYADFITLLFAFFVVMYAVSSVNEGKYRVLSETLNSVFSDSSKNPNLPSAAAAPPAPEPLPLAPPIPEPIPISPARSTSDPGEGQLGRLRKRLAISLAPYLKTGQVEIGGDGDRIEVRIKSRLLFGSGSTQINRKAMSALRDLAKVLVPLPNAVQVEGHTDNVPISTLQFPSNWELSAARAASVVHFMTRLGVEAEHLAAVGFGEHRPLASNATESGRTRNRRVTLAILAPKVVPWAEGPGMGDKIDWSSRLKDRKGEKVSGRSP
jgi:chemotaxis protein MotB